MNNKIFKTGRVIIATILCTMLGAILMTFALDFLVQKFGHQERFEAIFSTGGVFIGMVVISVICFYTFNSIENNN